MYIYIYISNVNTNNIVQIVVLWLNNWQTEYMEEPYID